MDINFDGKQLLELLLVAELQKASDPFTSKVLQIFQKHGIGAFDGLGILLEIAVAAQEIKKDEADEKVE